MSERRRVERADNAPTGSSPSQLRLLPGGERHDWVLDERTRRLGRRGVAEAREVLRRARPPEPKALEPQRRAS